MRIGIVLICLTLFLMANIYTDGKYVKLLWTYKKYYQMAGIAFGGLVLYWLFTKNPHKAGEMIATSHEYLKYLPIDQNTSNILSPILDFTAKHNYSQFMDNKSLDMYSVPTGSVPTGSVPSLPVQMGGQKQKATKRSVSETKKKFVASQQNWKCGHCGEQLTAWYEVDHIIRLEYGGSNEIDNLVALCRDCHGKKTTIENL
jgi:hypothetical protein